MTPARLRPLALAAALLVAPGGPAAACGTGGEPCRIAGGEYLVALPEGPARGAVIFLHGWGGRAEAEMGNAGLRDSVRARGYAYIAPQGLPFSPDLPKADWNAEADPARRDDVAFLAAVADDAAARHGLPRARMLLAGFSSGGMMVWRAACAAPAAFAGFAPVAGTFWRPLPERCAGPVRLFHTHGFADPVVPLEGRPIPQAGIEQGDVFLALDLARTASACAKDSPDAHAVVGELLVRSWTACAPGAALAFALHPGGHWVPPGWTGLVLDWLEGLAAKGRG